MNDLIGHLKSQYNGKKVLVVGLGLQGGGVGLAKFFADLGAKVTVTDKKTKEQLIQSINRLNSQQINLTLGRHKRSDFLNADIIFKTPKMRWDDPLILESQKKGIQIEMETSFFAEHCPAPIIGITGTRGKSTTTMMIHEILKKHSRRTVHLAGNLPKKLAISLLPQIKLDDLVILELSSWQLSGFHRKKISPHISIFTNFYPDHYDYYKTEEEYLYDKKAIYLYQKKIDYLIANKKLETIVLQDKLNNTRTFFDEKDFPSVLVHLRGVHNRENAAAALQVAKILNLDLQKSIETIKSFKGLSYRQQIIREKKGIIFVNDTTSTTPTATLKALEAFHENPIVLILGGNSKRLPAVNLINKLADTKKLVLLTGSFTDEIYPVLLKKYKEKITEQFSNLTQAIKTAYNLALKIKAREKKKVFVLFSPGATSFAMFNNEFHRGDEFNKVVNKLT